MHFIIAFSHINIRNSYFGGGGGSNINVVGSYKPNVLKEDSVDMPHLMDEQETWMGR